jgi:hypothetical protein
MGGLISLYGWMEYPEIFEGAACLSTHWPLGFDAKTNQANVLLEYLRKSVPEPSRRRLYMDTGDQELDALYLPSQLQADSIFMAAGYTSRQYLSCVAIGHSHNEVDWARRLPGAFRFMMGNGADMPSPGNNFKVAGTSTAPNAALGGGSKGKNANKSGPKVRGSAVKNGTIGGSNTPPNPKK